MKMMHPTLINFSLFSQFYGYVKDFNTKIYISANGIIHTERIICCGHPCSYNGSNESGHIVSRSTGSIFKKGQQICKTCGKTHQVDCEFIDIFKEDLDSFIIAETLSLREIHNSYSDISQHLSRTKGIMISETTLKEICDAKLSEFDDLELDYEIEEGFYGYDEQYVTVKGKKMLRIVIFDCKKNVPIYEDMHEKLTQTVLEGILSKVFKDKQPKGFVFDMLPMYPNAFRRVFGKRIKLQLCIFHLNKLILEEYRNCLKIGTKVNWNLIHYYNLYTIFNIFYNRKQELDLLKKYQEDLQGYKEKLSLVDDIDSFIEGFKFPKHCKTREDKELAIIRAYEVGLIKKFREHLHQEKLRRKRDKVTLESRNPEDARKQLNEVLELISYYPEKIQKRIKKIDEYFGMFTASDTEILTNNKLEGFFGSTLKKFRKKGFHSITGLKNFLTFQKIRRAGIEPIEMFSVQRLSVIFGILSLFII